MKSFYRYVDTGCVSIPEIFIPFSTTRKMLMGYVQGSRKVYQSKELKSTVSMPKHS